MNKRVEKVLKILRNGDNLCDVQALVDEDNVNETDRNGNTVLHHAVHKGCFKVTQWLLSMKMTNVNALNYVGRNALFMTRALWHACVMVSPVDKRLWSNSGFQDHCARILLEAGSRHDLYILRVAITCGSQSMIELLVDYGVNVPSDSPKWVRCLKSEITTRRTTCLSILQLKRRRGILLGQNNGRDMLRIVAMHIWSRRRKF